MIRGGRRSDGLAVKRIRTRSRTKPWRHVKANASCDIRGEAVGHASLRTTAIYGDVADPKSVRLPRKCGELGNRVPALKSGVATEEQVEAAFKSFHA
jgi:hypothetical protein